MNSKILTATILILSVGSFIGFILELNPFYLFLGSGILFFGMGLRFKRYEAIYIIFSTVALIFSLLEIISPYINISSKQSQLKKSNPIGYFAKTELGAQGLPGKQWGKLYDPSDQEIYKVTYTIGSDGFRVTPIHFIRGAPRINFFGCSFVFGEGVEDDETLPYYFAAQNSFAVKNYGFHGYGPHQALAILQSKQETSAAANFLLTAPWHAERSGCKASFSKDSPRYQLNARHELIRIGVCDDAWFDPKVEKYLKLSNLYNTIKSAVNKIQSEYGRDKDFELYLQIVSQIKRESTLSGQKFIIGFIKADDSYFKNTHYSNEKIANELKKIGDEFIDLTLAERSEEIPPQYYIHELDRHPSALANEKRAQLMGPIMSGLLKKN